MYLPCTIEYMTKLFCTLVISHVPELTLSRAPAHLFFHNFEVSQDGSNQSLKNYGFIWDAIFFTLCMCTKHLAAKCDYHSKIAELELQLHVCTKTGSLVHSIYIHCRKPVRTDLLLPTLSIGLPIPFPCSEPACINVLAMHHRVHDQTVLYFSYIACARIEVSVRCRKGTL